MIEVRTEHRKTKIANAKKLLCDLSYDLSANKKRKFKYLQEKGIGTWMEVSPSFSCGTILSETEFRDELSNRCSLNYLMLHLFVMVVDV